MRKLVLTPKLLDSQLSKCFNPNSISHRPSVTKLGSRLNHLCLVKMIYFLNSIVISLVSFNSSTAN